MKKQFTVKNLLKRMKAQVKFAQKREDKSLFRETQMFWAGRRTAIEGFITELEKEAL